MYKSKQWLLREGTDPGGGGGGGYLPQILVGMCRGKVKNGQGLWNELPVERENAGSGTSLSRFELENAGLRNELNPFLAWKWESPELPGRVWLTRVRAEPAVGADERVEIKEILKMMVSGTAKSAKKCKMVILWNRFFGNLWTRYAPEQKFGAENGGVSRGTYPICIHMEVPPPGNWCQSKVHQRLWPWWPLINLSPDQRSISGPRHASAF